MTKTINVTNNITAITSSTNTSCGTCSTGIASIVASGGNQPYTYTWSPYGGNNSTANNLGPGCYTVTVKDANACSTLSSTCIGFISGIEKLTYDNSEVLIYPNPANSKCTIEYYGKLFNYYLYNNLGQLVSENKNNKNSTIIDLSNYTKGVYFIEIEAGKDRFRKKIIVN
jgi:hypothetical protein